MEYRVEIEANTTITVEAENSYDAEQKALEEFWENVSSLEPEVTEVSEY